MFCKPFGMVIFSSLERRFSACCPYLYIVLTFCRGRLDHPVGKFRGPEPPMWRPKGLDTVGRGDIRRATADFPSTAVARPLNSSDTVVSTAMGAVVRFHGLIQHAAVGQRIESAAALFRSGACRGPPVPVELLFHRRLFGNRSPFHRLTRRKIGFTKSCCHLVLSYPTTLGCTSHIGLCIPKRRRFHTLKRTAVAAPPCSYLNMHSVAAFINYAPFLLFAALTPVCLVAVAGIHGYLIVGIAVDQSNYSLAAPKRLPLLPREMTKFHRKPHTEGTATSSCSISTGTWSSATGTSDGLVSPSSQPVCSPRTDAVRLGPY